MQRMSRASKIWLEKVRQHDYEECFWFFYNNPTVKFFFVKGNRMDDGVLAELFTRR